MEIQPLRALHYDLRAVGGLDQVVAPPYDVIDEPMREELANRSPFNVVEIDLPRIGGEGEGAAFGEMEPGDPYLHAQTTLQEWIQQGIVVRDREPAIWPMTQEFKSPDAATATRHGFFCRVRVCDYGPSRIRPHERTHPGPKEDRLRLTRAARANLSPIFSLYDDPEQAAWEALAEATRESGPFGEATDAEGTTSRLWRVTDADAIAAVEAARAELGRIHGLVDIVGMARYREALETTDEDWDWSFDMVLRHAFLFSQLAGKAMTEDGGGVMVFVASVSGITGAPRHAAYGAAKAGLMAWVRSVAVELGPSGIRVNAVAPGVVLTPRVAGYLDDRSRELQSDNAPLRRVAVPSDIASAILFLASDLSAYVTGQTLVVDGGVAAKFPYPMEL